MSILADDLRDPVDLQPGKDGRQLTDQLQLFLICLLAIVPRLWHINWGLPELYEEATPFRIALQFWNSDKSSLNLNPHFFNYPAFTFYLQFIAQVIHYGIGHLLGFYPDVRTFLTNSSASIIIARLVTLLFDIGTIIVVYRLGKQCSDRRVACVAAFLVAINPLHIKQSHLINVDIPLTCFSLLSLFFIYHIFTDSARKWYVLAGVAIGLAAASKYTGAFLLITLVVVHAMRRKSFRQCLYSLWSISLLISIALSVIVFFIFNPYILLSIGEFQKDFSFEQAHMSYGHIGVDLSQTTFEFYFLQILPLNLGWIFFAVVLASIIYLVTSGKKSNFVLLIFPLVCISIIGSWAMRADRYIMPIIPVLILIGSIGIVKGWDFIVEFLGSPRLKRITESPWHRISGATIVAMIVAIPLLAEDVRYHQSFSLPDTRTVAKEWIVQHLPAGSTIATGPFGIPIPEDQYKIVNIPFVTMGAEWLAPFYNTQWYEDLDVLIASDYDHARFSQEPKRFRRILSYYDTLRSRWKLATEIRPSSEQNGPLIWIYQPPSLREKAVFDENLLQSLNIIGDTTIVSDFAERLAFVLFLKQKLEKSDQLMRVAVSLDPNNADKLREFAWTLFNRGKYEDALKWTERSLRIETTAELLALRGSSLLRLKRPDEAESILKQAIALNERLEIPYRDLFLLYRQRNDTGKMIDILSRYLKTLPPESEAATGAIKRLHQLRGVP